MASKFVIFAAAMAVANAAPFTITANNYYPNGIPFETPSIAYGFGGGISSNIGGIRHSSGFGTAYEYGDAQAYGAGYAGSDEKTYAGGVGSAYTGGAGSANPRGSNVIYYPVQTTKHQPPTILTSNSRPRYSGHGAAIAQSQTGPNFGTAFSTTTNLGGASFSRADNSYGNSIATAHSLGGGTSISSAQNYGDQSVSTAHTDGAGGQAGAISYNSGGHQISQSHVLNY